MRPQVGDEDQGEAGIGNGEGPQRRHAHLLRKEQGAEDDDEQRIGEQDHALELRRQGLQAGKVGIGGHPVAQHAYAHGLEVKQRFGVDGGQGGGLRPAGAPPGQHAARHEERRGQGQAQGQQ